MEPIPTDQNELIIQLLRQNQELLQQNNELLLKQERRERRKLILKIIWYTILLGVPMIAYYYLYSAFIGTVGSNPPVSGNGVGVTPELLNELLEIYQGR